MSKAQKRTKAGELFKRFGAALTSATRHMKLEARLLQIERHANAIFEEHQPIITTTKHGESWKLPPQRGRAIEASAAAKRTRDAIASGDAEKAASWAAQAMQAYHDMMLADMENVVDSVLRIVDGHCIEWRGRWFHIAPDSMQAKALRFIGDSSRVNLEEFCAFVWGTKPPKAGTFRKFIVDLNAAMKQAGCTWQLKSNQPHIQIISRATR